MLFNCAHFSGNNMHDPKRVILLVAENTVVLRTKSLIKGCLLLLGSYYVFGLKYLKSVTATLEYMQR